MRYILTENEEGWIDGEEPTEGWRNEQMILDGAQIGVDIFMEYDNSAAKMARNVYQLAKFLGSDFIWYDDAYMKNVVHRCKDQSNQIFDYIKDTIMKDVYEEYPELFEIPPKMFWEDPLRFQIYKLEEE